MRRASDLTQFKRWYDQAGTPVLDVSDEVRSRSRSATRCAVRQSCPPTPERSDKLPFHIPLALGLVDPDGNDIPLKLDGRAARPQRTRRAYR